VVPRSKQTDEATGGIVLSHPVANGVKIYKGAFVTVESDGYAAPCGTSATTLPCIGVALEQKDNTSGANGDLDVKILSGAYFALVVGAETIADIGQKVWCKNDDSLIISVSSANEPFGTIVGWDKDRSVHVVKHAPEAFPS
jgi:hypothetical protein